jgi:hypothetical protein
MHRQVLLHIGVILSLVANAGAQETVTRPFNYEMHFAGSDPNNPSITRYATGTLTVTRPSIGANLSTTPFRSRATIQMQATSSAVAAEWAMANHPMTHYSFATRLNNDPWATIDQTQPDSFTPQSSTAGRWTWREEVLLSPTSGRDDVLQVDMYVSCCRCRRSLQIPPGAGQANLRVSIEIRWTTDASGVVTASSFSGFAVEQSTNLNSGSPIHATRRDGGQACPTFTAAEPHASTSPYTNPDVGTAPVAQAACPYSYCPSRRAYSRRCSRRCLRR